LPKKEFVNVFYWNSSAADAKAEAADFRLELKQSAQTIQQMPPSCRTELLRSRRRIAQGLRSDLTFCWRRIMTERDKFFTVCGTPAGAWLAMKGVHPKTIQTIMRHKTITLTMNTYGHFFPNAEPAAIAEICGIRERQ
jgi:integrase